MNYDEIIERGIKRTVISFEPFLRREDVRDLTDAGKAESGRVHGVCGEGEEVIERPGELPRALCCIYPIAVRTTVLTDDERRQLGVGIGDAHGVLQLLFIHKHQSEPPSSQGHGSLSHR